MSIHKLRQRPWLDENSILELRGTLKHYACRFRSFASVPRSTKMMFWGSSKRLNSTPVDSETPRNSRREKRFGSSESYLRASLTSLLTVLMSLMRNGRFGPLGRHPGLWERFLVYEINLLSVRGAFKHYACRFRGCASVRGLTKIVFWSSAGRSNTTPADSEASPAFLARRK